MNEYTLKGTFRDGFAQGALSWLGIGGIGVDELADQVINAFAAHPNLTLVYWTPSIDKGTFTLAYKSDAGETEAELEARALLEETFPDAFETMWLAGSAFAQDVVVQTAQDTADAAGDAVDKAAKLEGVVKWATIGFVAWVGLRLVGMLK